jgi:hypothetical protein
VCAFDFANSVMFDLDVEWECGCSRKIIERERER